MRLHELGLPLRIPSEEAVRAVLARGDHYDLACHDGKRLTISLAAVRLTKPHGLPVPLAESLIADWLPVVTLGQPGETWRHPNSVGYTAAELDAHEGSAHLTVSPRTQRVLARLLAVRARMRTELGM